MSERWRGYQQHESTNEDYKTMCMAAKYALHLRELHSKCQSEPNSYMDILGYSNATSDYDVGGLLPTILAQPNFRPFSPHPPLNNRGRSSEIENPNLQQGSRSYLQVLSPSPNPTSNPDHSQGYHPFNDSHPNAISNTSQLPPPFVSQGLDTNAQGTLSNDIMRNGVECDNIIVDMSGGNENIEDELTAMSHNLFGQQFLELDRVITLEGTDFDFDMNHWGTVS